MKKIKYILLAATAMLLFSCNKDTDPLPVNEVDGLIKVQDITNDTQVVELYTKTGTLTTGHNTIYLRVKDIASGAFINPVSLDWMPVMHMMSMNHSCPKSAITKVAGKQYLYQGYLVFQMPGNTSESWELTFHLSTGSEVHTAVGEIDVAGSALKKVTTITGADSKKYILSLIEPSVPIVGLNDLTVGVYTMESMMSFPAVLNYSLMIDPRMPSMGNHGSPSNVNPAFSATDNLYHGTLSLTMSGYWKINMILKNETDAILKGEEVTGSVESSSLYLEVEF